MHLADPSARSASLVTVPPSVTGIAYGGFQGCRYLTEVTIPGTVEEIGEQAFWACDRLASVTICHGVRRIKERAFRGYALFFMIAAGCLGFVIFVTSKQTWTGEPTP